VRFYGFWTIFAALSISIVAAYYSIIGLVAIFASAMIPIVIMGVVLEIGKLTSAVWLHLYWKQSALLIKTYLTIAVVTLMFITSMGIFGFLSKAHIEQTSLATEGVAQIERINTEIARNESIVARAEQKIIKAETSTGNANDGLQEQINTEQQRIDNTYARIQPAIDEQNTIIQNARADDATRTAPYEEQLTSIQSEVLRLEATADEYEQKITTLSADVSATVPLLDSITNIEQEIIRVTNQLQSKERGQIRAGQAIIGVTSDGAFGNNTRRALVTWVEAQRERITQIQLDVSRIRVDATTQVDSERTRLSDVIKNIRSKQIPALKEREITMLAKIDEVRATESPSIATARDEIARIRSSADAQILASQELIQRLRNNIQVGANDQVEEIVQDQTTKIQNANLAIDNLIEQKYTLEANARQLEAEVGPVKYIAEMVYGADAENMLEQAVRWVILLLVFVFDPLAIVLVIAGITLVENNPSKRKKIIKDKKIEPVMDEVVQPEVVDTPEVQESKIFVDEQGKQYTIDVETGKKNYLIDQQQYELNNKSRKQAHREATLNQVGKTVANMKQEGLWPSSSVPTERIAVKDIINADGTGEIEKMLEAADEETIQQVYQALTKEINTGKK
jgi:hypothetical protein